ncbi:peptidoglycan recognition family protein [Listeria sp. PSOL-1]|uniref:peptidoglycan recognition protein family protein n=1 Tax=Listeria sp. PSOL-1 TaxID=1844999 RepID=UPI0013D6ABE8|nr:peptidoglycan recognition family protein [Listeria sp. PSOL-1]
MKKYLIIMLASLSIYLVSNDQIIFAKDVEKIGYLVIERPHTLEKIKDFPKLPYRSGVGRPEGVILHSTGENDKTLEEWISYEEKTWENAFVHAFVDDRKAVEIADPNYLCWGAGKVANPRYVQVELVEFPDGTSKIKMMQSIEQYAHYIARVLKQFNIGKPTLADEINGIGTIITHNSVSKYLGGTTHTDPYNYLPKNGFSIKYVFSRINYYYYSI